MAQARRGAGGFTLLEVIVASGVFLIVLAALTSAVIYLVRLNPALSARSKLEAEASVALYQMLQGTPERPGLLAARTILDPLDGSSHKLKFQTEDGRIYEYSLDGDRLVLSVDGAKPITLLGNVKELHVVVSAETGFLPLVQITLKVAVPVPHGTAESTLTAEGVPRNVQ